MKYRDMNDQQRLQWGLAESDARQRDLAQLTAAQNAAAERRRAIAASVGQAARMVIEANRHRRTHPTGEPA